MNKIIKEDDDAKKSLEEVNYIFKNMFKKNNPGVTDKESL